MRKMSATSQASDSTLSQFLPPANQHDFADEPAKQAALNQAWTNNVHAWTRQAIVGNPWNVTNSSNQTFYYDPLATPNVPSLSNAIQVAWLAFPNRISYYYGRLLSERQQWELADTGLAEGVDLPEIPQSSAICEGTSQPTTKYGPYGPRGWQDEYCEWSVARDEKGNITRVDFTCENPEYWYTLWQISPQRVCDLYRQILNKPQIQLSDLYLRDPSTGEPVLEPDTGRYLYNPLNKWNCGTVSTPTSGGAIHLTSTPNNLGTEIALAGSATLQRKCGNADQETLLCYGQYGQPQRHSDPYIGQQANIAAETNRISLANPVGLYIQKPASWVGFSLPDDPNLPADAHASECWQVVRGQENLKDLGFNDSFNFILHVVFSIPQRWKDAGVTATVSDMRINGKRILYASQIAQQFQMALYPLPMPTEDRQTPLDHVVSRGQDTQAQPLQLFYASVFNAYYDTQIPNPRQVSMSLVSNTVLTPPQVAAGKTVKMVLTCDTVDMTQGNPAVEFLLPGATQPDAAVKAQVTGTRKVNYAIPGNSYPADYTSVELTLQIAPTAKPGIRDIRVTNAGQSPATPGPGFLLVV